MGIKSVGLAIIGKHIFHSSLSRKFNMLKIHRTFYLFAIKAIFKLQKLFVVNKLQYN